MPNVARSRQLSIAYSNNRLSSEECTMPKAREAHTSQHFLSEDPLIAIGRRLWELETRHDILDVPKSGETTTETIYRQTEASQTRSTIDALRTYASTLKAKSIEGALIQIGLAHSLVTRISDDNRKMSQTIEEEIDRLLFSAAAAMRSQCPAKIFYWHDWNSHVDPFKPYEDAVADVTSKDKLFRV